MPSQPMLMHIEQLENERSHTTIGPCWKLYQLQEFDFRTNFPFSPCPQVCFYQALLNTPNTSMSSRSWGRKMHQTNLPPYPTVPSHCSTSHSVQPCSTASRALPPVVKVSQARTVQRSKWHKSWVALKSNPFSTPTSTFYTKYEEIMLSSSSSRSTIYLNMHSNPDSHLCVTRWVLWELISGQKPGLYPTKCPAHNWYKPGPVLPVYLDNEGVNL